MQTHRILSMLSLGLGLASVSFATTITAWTFDGDVVTPSLGSGTASLIGGITSTFAAGNGGGRGWNTTNYAAQGVGSGTRGVEFMVSTVGFTDITFDFDHRASGTASRWADIQYTIDGGLTWFQQANNNGGLSPHDTFYSFNVDFSADPGTADNANFGVRVLSIFSPLLFDQNGGVSFAGDQAYMRANSLATYGAGSSGSGDYAPGGTWRFDNVVISGTPIPEPSAFAALAGLGALGAAALRRRRRA